VVTRREGPSTATIVRVILTAVAVLLVVYALYRVRAVLLLVFVAAFFAVGLDPAVRWLERKGIRRSFSVMIILLALLLVLGGFIAAVVPPLVEQIANFATNLPNYVQDLAERNPRFEAFIDENFPDIEQNLRDQVGSVPTAIGGSFGKVLGFAGTIVGRLFSTLTVIVLMIYFLGSLSRVHAGTLKLVPASKRERFRELLDPILEKIGQYIAGNVAISVIAGVLSFAFFAIAGVPYPVALALWVAIADLLPLVGATVGAVPAVIVAFFASVPLGIATLIFFIIYQQLENYLIAPKVMKEAVDVSPAAVLLAALIGGSLLGFFGALVAIPAAAAIKLITQEVVLPKVDRA
jgi:predicted PurR-regulated permease PerM